MTAPAPDPAKALADLAGIIAALMVITTLVMGPFIYRAVQLKLLRERIADQDRAIDGMRDELEELRDGRQRDRQRLEQLIRREAEAEHRLTRQQARLYSQERYIQRLERLCRGAALTLPRRDLPEGNGLEE